MIPENMTTWNYVTMNVTEEHKRSLQRATSQQSKKKCDTAVLAKSARMNSPRNEGNYKYKQKQLQCYRCNRTGHNAAKFSVSIPVKLIATQGVRMKGKLIKIVYPVGQFLTEMENRKIVS